MPEEDEFSTPPTAEEAVAMAHWALTFATGLVLLIHSENPDEAAVVQNALTLLGDAYDAMPDKVFELAVAAANRAHEVLDAQEEIIEEFREELDNFEA